MLFYSWLSLCPILIYYLAKALLICNEKLKLIRISLSVQIKTPIQIRMHGQSLAMSLFYCCYQVTIQQMEIIKGDFQS